MLPYSTPYYEEKCKVLSQRLSRVQIIWEFRKNNPENGDWNWSFSATLHKRRREGKSRLPQWISNTESNQCKPPQKKKARGGKGSANEETRTPLWNGKMILVVYEKMNEQECFKLVSHWWTLCNQAQERQADGKEKNPPKGKERKNGRKVSPSIGSIREQYRPYP